MTFLYRGKMTISNNIVKAKKLIAEVKNSNELYTKAVELASLMLKEALRIQTASERRMQKELARMMGDPTGKTFTIQMTDQCFRSDHVARVADQLVYLIHKYGVPSYLSPSKQFGLTLVKLFGDKAPKLFVPLVRKMLRNATAPLILPGETQDMLKHMKKRRQEGIRINLNHLGEAILGENEAQKRLQIYLDDLANPEVDYISVKISTICSQLNLISWEKTVEILSERLKQLYRAAMSQNKFVNLDMEEYRDLHLTVEVFQRVLDEQEFQKYSAGIVLQSYLPDSFQIQRQLTEWALQRVKNGGAPIKIRIVKGANLAMERVDAAIHEWPQAPYETKADTDANFKRMVNYGCETAHAKAVHIGVASHNLFDIAYALLLRNRNGVEKEVSFEMLEGMADHMRRVVQKLAGGILLYCPVATREEFQNAVAYLVRRLDENTAEENFLRHTFGITPQSEDWQQQSQLFLQACENAKSVSEAPRRNQDRNQEVQITSLAKPFQNEPDTDWSLKQNREWIKKAIETWKPTSTIPLVIDGEQILTEDVAKFRELYTYSLAKIKHADEALKVAAEAYGKRSAEERAHLLLSIAYQLRNNRGRLITAMMDDTAKTVFEGDVEVSEAIDFAEYYARDLLEIASMKDLQWSPRGVVLVAPPWNFPCSIPAGGILAALAAGNSVIFKPAPEAILVGWELAQLFWKAGVSKQELQFMLGEDDTIGSYLVKDPRISAVVLTGATSTAQMMLKMRPSMHLFAETGGKNAMILSNLCDRDLAVKDLVQSAFGHAGQKCSACSLAILEKELYDDPQFKEHLRDAAASLHVGDPRDLTTKVSPLIREPNPALKRGLTSLDEGEEWLLEPKQDAKDPLLWSPGIKLGVKPGSFTHQTELFGPVLGLMRADSLQQAIEIANATPYGLTSGLHSLDKREQQEWLEKIQAGNCYINRGITGAIVQRQPFGGCKDSGFGPGAKAGGPNYVMQLMKPEQTTMPEEKADFDETPQEMDLEESQKQLWKASVQSYNYYWQKYFSQKHDPSKVLGQYNILMYKPHDYQVLRLQENDSLTDVWRFVSAAAICHANVEISTAKPIAYSQAIVESDEEFILRLEKQKFPRVRFLSQPSEALLAKLADISCRYQVAPILANGRVELLHYLREVSLSIDHHRYGNVES